GDRPVGPLGARARRIRLAHLVRERPRRDPPGLTVEPDLRTELALTSHVDFLRAASVREPDGAVLDEDGLFLYAGPHPLPVLVNGALRVEPGLEAHEVIDRARTFFVARGRGFSVYGVVGRDDDLIVAAEGAGMSAFGDPAPFMVLTDPLPPTDLPSGVRLERVTSAQQVADAAAVCADAYSVYGMPAEVAPACLTPRTMLAPDTAAVVAYDRDGPAATATAMAARGVSYLSWVGTAPRAMRRGLGEAVTRAATAAGLELGADVPALLASPMGAPVYRRMGFADVGSLASRVALDAVGRKRGTRTGSVQPSPCGTREAAMFTSHTRPSARKSATCS